MTPVLTVLAVCAAGGAGAAARLVLDGIIRTRATTAYPVGTTVINLTGSLLLGLLTGLGTGALVAPAVHVITGAGFLGGYTTFSTASFETVRLLQDGRPVAALSNGLGLLGAATAAAALGLRLGLAVSS